MGRPEGRKRPGISSFIPSLSLVCGTLFSVAFTGAAAPAGSQEPVAVLSIGDSITEGSIDGAVDTENRFTAVLERLLAARAPSSRVENRGVGGQVSTEGAMSLGAHLSAEHPDIVTLLYGANDLLLEYGGEPRVSPANFAEALRFMVRAVKSERAVPVLLSPVPVIPDKYYEGHERELYESLGGIEEHWMVYDLEVRRVADEEEVVLFDLQLLFGDRLEEALGEDGAHPSELGHQMIGSGLFTIITGLELPDSAGGGMSGTGKLSDCYVYPNPCFLSDGGLVKVHVRVSGPGELSAKVFDPTGRKIVTLPDLTFQNEGEHFLVWDGKTGSGDPVSPGVYFMCLDWFSAEARVVGRKVLKVAVLR